MPPGLRDFEIFGHSVRRDIRSGSLIRIGLQAALKLTELLQILLAQIILLVRIFSKIEKFEYILIGFFSGIIGSNATIMIFEIDHFVKNASFRGRYTP